MTLPKTKMSSRSARSSLEGYRILWCRQNKLSKSDKQVIKKNLLDMSQRVLDVMKCAKEEGLQEESAIARMPLPHHAHFQAYLTIERCNGAWHIFVETLSECIGEVVGKDERFIQMLKEDEFEEEVL